MASNFPGPYVLEYSYTVDSLVHKLALNMDMDVVGGIGDDFTLWSIKNRSAVPITLDAFDITLMVSLVQFFNVAVTFDTATLYSVAPLSFDRTWQSEKALGVAGTSVVATSDSKQRIFTFRSQEGGVSRLTFMEAVAILDDQRGFAAYSAGEVVLSNLFTSLDSPILARDTSYLIAPIRASDGQNEKTWRQRNR